MFYTATASSLVHREAEELGHWNILISTGARVLPAGCDSCIDLGGRGETGVSATNRNYEGKTKHPKAQTYLASPAAVAASAVKGFIRGSDSLNPNTLPKTDRPARTSNPRTPVNPGPGCTYPRQDFDRRPAGSQLDGI